MKIIIRFGAYTVEAELNDTPTAQKIYEALPLKENVNRWGDEIYFGLPVQCKLEAGARAQVKAGDLAYWPNMPAFCIFFGPTPSSSGIDPVAASPVNVFGKLSNLDLEKMRQIADGENVWIEKSA